MLSRRALSDQGMEEMILVISDEQVPNVESLLQSSIGETIWSAIVGGTNDYVLSLQMGEREARSARLANPRLSFLQRTYEGSVGFLIECPWRLDGPEQPICSNLSVLDRDERTLEEFGWLFMDLTVKSFEFDPRAGDLQLYFASGDRLSVFAAEVQAPRTMPKKSGLADRGVRRRRPQSSRRNNWSFWSPSGGFEIARSGEIRGENADADPGPATGLTVLPELEPES